MRTDSEQGSRAQLTLPAVGRATVETNNNNGHTLTVQCPLPSVYSPRDTDLLGLTNYLHGHFIQKMLHCILLAAMSQETTCRCILSQVLDQTMDSHFLCLLSMSVVFYIKVLPVTTSSHLSRTRISDFQLLTPEAPNQAKAAMEAAKTESKLVTLPPRGQSSSVMGVVKKIGLRTLAWLGVYLLGYFDYSVAWLVTPLILSVVRDEWKKDKRNRLAAAREAALSNEQAMVEARLDMDELPSWVFFPDRERAEWLNNIIKRLWPYVNEYVRNTLFQSVEPAVEEALKGYKLSPFKFERDRVFLGQVPPRITGIKVYDSNVSRKEIIMDVDIIFASDLEIVFKIKGISAKVSDFGLRGMARIVLKPLINDIPLIGGVQVYFLKPPEIDYNLGGVAGALEIPGLSRIVERIIVEQIKNFIVLPNKFSMPLVESVPNKVLKCPDSAGVLRVKMIQAKDLVDLDGLGSGKSDPYVILTVGAHTFRMPTMMDTCNPKWETNNVFDFPIEVVHGQELLMEFYDDDSRKDDEFMGRAKIQTNLVAQRGHIEVSVLMWKCV